MSDSRALVPVTRGNDWPVAVRHMNGNETEFPRDIDEQHARLIRWFEEAERASQDAREASEMYRRYVNCEQWTQAELSVLRARGQPPISFNYVRRKTEILCGLERKARTDPKAFPRTPAEDDRADAATQCLRYIADDQDFQALRSGVFNEILVEGFGGCEVGLEDDGKGGCNVTLKQVSWDRIWYDPHSRQDDFLDARYKGLVIWMDRDQLEETYPDAPDVIDDSFSTGDATQYDDRPGYMTWTDSNRTRCRVVQCHWSQEGAWWNATFTRAGYLTEPKRSMFKDRHGKSACPLLLRSAYTDLDNTRYGMVRDLISPQDMINKAYSKALHQMSVHQAIAEQGAVLDEDKARRELAKPDGLIITTPGLKFEIQDGVNMAQGQIALLTHAVQEMQLSGPNAAMSGTDTRELSGRAILAQQAGGATQNEPLADGLRMWARNVYEMAWMAAREYWSAGKWVRVTDDLNETRWVGINRPIKLQDELAAMPEQQRAVVMQRMQPPLQPGDPRLQQVIRIENDITDLDVDITIQEGPDIPAMQAETFQTLVQLASIQPGLIPGDVLIAASSLRDKDAILERMKEHQQQQQQMQQQAAQMAGQHAQADIASKQAKAAADMSLAKERNINAVKGVHDMHSDFSAPPYGQPFVGPPPDAPSAPGTVGPQITPHAGGGLVTRTLSRPDAIPPEPFMPAPVQTLVPPATQQDQQRIAQAQNRLGLEGFGVNDIGPNAPPVRSWFDSLPRFQGVDPNFRSYQPPGSADNIGIQYPDEPHSFQAPPGFVYPPVSHATGGPVQQVTPMNGPNPPGPDNGYITAKAGEYVLNQGAVQRYGQSMLDALNAGVIDPQTLQMAAAHSAADLRAKNAKAAVDEAKAMQVRHDSVNTIADTHQTMVTTNRLARTPIPQPAPPASP